jgi:hypothetical protein
VPRRTAPFPNGDVRDSLTPRETESPRAPEKYYLTCIDCER